MLVHREWPMGNIGFKNFCRELESLKWANFFPGRLFVPRVDSFLQQPADVTAKCHDAPPADSENLTHPLWQKTPETTIKSALRLKTWRPNPNRNKKKKKKEKKIICISTQCFQATGRRRIIRRCRVVLFLSSPPFQLRSAGTIVNFRLFNTENHETYSDFEGELLAEEENIRANFVSARLVNYLKWNLIPNSWNFHLAG